MSEQEWKQELLRTVKETNETVTMIRISQGVHAEKIKSLEQDAQNAYREDQLCKTERDGIKAAVKLFGWLFGGLTGVVAVVEIIIHAIK